MSYGDGDIPKQNSDDQAWFNYSESMLSVAEDEAVRRQETWIHAGCLISFACTTVGLLTLGLSDADWIAGACLFGAFATLGIGFIAGIVAYKRRSPG